MAEFFNKKNQEKTKDIFGTYIFYTNITIFALILLVPVGTYLITGDKAFLSWEHFVLASFIGILQILVTRLFRNQLFRFIERIRKNFEQLSLLLKNIKKFQDIKKFKREKEILLKPLFEEENLKPLGESINQLLEEISNAFEIKLFKEELIRKLTTTLNTDRLVNIVANNFIRFFDLQAIAVYLKDLRNDFFVLKLNKGFTDIEPFLDKSFLEKLSLTDDILGEENLELSIDLGLCKLNVDKVYIHKLIPRNGKLIGIIFFAPSVENKSSIVKRLRNFLEEMEPTLSLIFENALEHEKSLAMTSFDPLTGAYSRSEGFKIVKKLLQKASLENKNLCLIILDIDHFKKFNDTYGHDAGDMVLKEVVKAIKNSIRDNDMVIRWGGEEFLIVLDGVPADKVGDVAERIRKNIEAKKIILPNGKEVRVTASLGVACTKVDGTFSFDELFLIGDKRLYKAKRMGRNRVVVN
jgi:diguanylate cyclase (GGDEF)-like protein